MGFRVLLHVVRRPPHVAGKKSKMSGLLSPLFFCSVDGFCGTATGEQQNWLVPGPPARRLRSVFEKDYYRELVDAGGCGCGWAWSPGRDCVGRPIHAAPFACANPLYS